MARLDVLVIPAARTPIGKRLQVPPASVLPQARVPAGRVVGPVGDTADRLRSIQRFVGPVFGAVSVSGRDRKSAHGTAAAGSSLGSQDVVLLGRARPRAE